MAPLVARALAVAHRGDPIGHRENTLPAFVAAAQAGADMVEVDLQVTSDGEIVVLHDPTLSRLWGVQCPVGDLTLREVSQLGSGELRVPTLAQVLATVEIPLMIDFTHSLVVPQTLGVVREARAMDRSLFVSGNLEALANLRILAPEAQIGLTWMQTNPPAPRVFEALQAQFFNPFFSLVNAELVMSMHAHGLSLSTWTVDAPEDMVHLCGMGIDAIVTNHIAQLVVVLDEMVPHSPKV